MADITYVTIPELTAAQDSQVTDSALIEMAVVDGSAASGYASKKVTKEQLLSDLRSDLGDLSDLDTTVKTDLVSAINEVAQGGGGSLTQDTKQALLQCFAHTAWTDDQGQDYYDDLEDALYPFDLLSSISAAYTQSGTVYDTDSLDSLKDDLVVTGNYSDGTYNQTTKYTLSGTLTAGTSTITVTYGGKTATFTVTVTQSQAVLTSITCVYTQSGTVYDTDSLDSLKTDLVVTAHYSDSTTETVASSDYTLSGTLTVGTSTITVSYSGKTTTFNVTVTEYVDPRTLLYNWDLTNSLVDTVGSVTAELYAASGVSNPTQNSSGLTFNAATQGVWFGNIDFTDKTLEIDVASFSFAGNSSNHIRFVLNAPTGGSSGYGALIYRSGQGWSGYGIKTAEGSSSRGWFTNNWISGTSSEVVNAFNGKTVKLIFDADGHTVSLYVNNSLIGTQTEMYYSNSYQKGFHIGALRNGSQSSGDQCYNMTITGVRVYANS